MAYVLNQFNQSRTEASATTTSVNETYMTQLTGGVAKRRKNASDFGVTGSALDPFYDECVVFDSHLNIGTNYYLHAKIKRATSDQTFYIYLVNYDSTDTSSETQYLKTITVQAGSEGEWVDFETIFTPIINFDCILFQLQRTIEDYRTETRYPTIVYEELSSINNLISNKIKNGASLVKLGIQSHPGLMLCVNGEEIHLGRTGIYEVRNGVVSVDFLSVIKAAVENPKGSLPLVVNGQNATIEEYLGYLAGLDTITTIDDTNSRCIFSNSKTRSIDSFVVDYMYKED